MTSRLILIFMLLCAVTVQAQKFKVEAGSIEAVSQIERYNLVFEYAQDLEIHRYDSEETFLSAQSEKRERKKPGSGETFKKLWFDNRVNQYEPTFIQEFNSFNIENEQVTVAKNITSTAHTMRIKTSSIGTGYNDLFYVEAGEIEVEIRIYVTDNPENILYGLNTTVRGNIVADEFERLRTAYGNLGLAISKHLSRKGLLKRK